MAGRGSTGGIRGALRHRDFRLLLAGQAVSATGDWLYNVALVVYVLDQTGSGAWVAATTLVRFLPYVLLGTFGGVLADRYDRRLVMILSDLARTVVLFALTLVAAGDGPAIAAVALAGLSTVFSSAYFPAVRAATPTLVGEDDLAGANTLVSTIDNVALAVGPAIGGVLLLLGSPVAAFGVNAATFLVSGIFAIGIRTPLLPAAAGEEESASLPERMREGFGAIGGSSTVKVLLVMSLALTVFYGMEIVLWALAAEELFEIGDDGLAFLWAAIGLGGVLAAGITGRVAARPHQAAILGFLNIASAVPIVVLAFGGPSAAVYPLVAIEGATVIVSDVVFMTMMQRTVSGDVLGRVFGIMDSIMVAGIMVGTVVAPLIVEVAGLEAAMISAGALVVVITLLAFPKARAVDREAAERAAALAGVVALLDRVEIFDDASRTTLEGLAASAIRREIGAGTIVIHEGEEADDLFVIESGTMRVTARGEPVRELGADDHFGEIGVIERLPRTATVTASTDGVVYRISGEDFLRAVSEAPRMSGRFVTTMVTRLARTHPEHAPHPASADSTGS